MALLACYPTCITADWVDPDTPWDARTTHPYNVKAPYIPKEEDDDKKTTTSGKKHQYVTLDSSMMPSAAPSPTTSAPSHTPSSAPSPYPTFNPERTFELVFSDEFNTPFRNFRDGSDPRWTALDKNDYTNDALHYYTPENAWTNEDGHLVIRSMAQDTEIVGFDDVKLKKTKVTKHFRSAMLQTWNKFCFTGGIMEAEVILPGKSNVGGLWPAFWLLGNMARHTYVGTSEHIWPWSSILCTAKSGDSQKVSGCDNVAHYGLQPRLGRGAPEIDVFEVQAGNIHANQGPFFKSSVGQPFMSSSFQVAPGRPSNRPGPGEWPGPEQWYKGLLGGKNTSLNILFYGNYNHFLGDVHPARQDYWSDAISMNRQLNESFFTLPHVYRVEWDVPTEEKDGYLHWFLDGELVFSINGTGIRASGLGSEISSEPSYILLNTAISKQWGFPLKCPTNCPCKVYDCHSTEWQSLCGFSEGFCDMMKSQDPPDYKINWVRVYQDPDDPVQKVGCSTPERPTRRYIEAHESSYKTEYDEHPLKGIQRGGGTCNPAVAGVRPEACGGNERGRCTKGKVCECMPGWTGPRCLAREGRDPVLYDLPETISDVGFFPPKVVPRFLLVGFGVLVLLLLIALQWKHHLQGWTPIPDADFGVGSLQNAKGSMNAMTATEISQKRTEISQKRRR